LRSNKGASKDLIGQDQGPQFKYKPQNEESHRKIQSMTAISVAGIVPMPSYGI
jgi:hypothetical protein